jgi:hypothetical protein
MSTDVPDTPFWTRVVADAGFREAVIDDPLRALAGTDGIAVSTEQVRQLEEMDRDERAEAIEEIVREVHLRGASARFGDIGPDGRLGGGSTG